MRDNRIHAFSARHKRGFTPLKEAAGGIGPPSAQTARERNSLTGFTLIELIIVISILSVVSLAVYTSFSSGINIWQRINEKSPEEDMNIFLDKFAFDLKNSFKFTGINFSGRKDGLEFPVLLKSSGLHKKSVGKVVYSYDSKTDLFNREEADFSQIYEDERETIKHSLNNVKSFKFQYYTYDKGKREYLWQGEWAKEGLPLAVKIYLEIEDGDKINGFTRTVGVPTGS